MKKLNYANLLKVVIVLLAVLAGVFGSVTIAKYAHKIDAIDLNVAKLVEPTVTPTVEVTASPSASQAPVKVLPSKSVNYQAAPVTVKPTVKLVK